MKWLDSRQSTFLLNWFLATVIGMIAGKCFSLGFESDQIFLMINLNWITAIAFTLFGRYTFVFTGMQVLKLDGSKHHGVGIQPTVIATRTLGGVREGRDELLESAIETVTRK